jgi:hypothetical protein
MHASALLIMEFEFSRRCLENSNSVAACTALDDRIGLCSVGGSRQHGLRERVFLLAEAFLLIGLARLTLLIRAHPNADDHGEHGVTITFDLTRSRNRTT